MRPESENPKSYNDLISLEPNQSISLLSQKGSYLTYVLFIVALRIIVGVFEDDPGNAWTITNSVHNLVTYIVFHWIKGVPNDNQQSSLALLTLWEQLDNGKQNTITRKFYTLVPIFLILIANHYCVGKQFWFNFAQFCIILVAKFPLMHKKRIFGIGKY
ncbi:ORM1-like protein 1 [Zophobas morio]|uniref:ORM1-like protein 1 n=1 Tax=Zophobas morio TaxID=2755281 RepID=UPI00308311EA